MCSRFQYPKSLAWAAGPGLAWSWAGEVGGRWLVGDGGWWLMSVLPAGDRAGPAGSAQRVQSPPTKQGPSQGRLVGRWASSSTRTKKEKHARHQPKTTRITTTSPRMGGYTATPPASATAAPRIDHANGSDVAE